MNNIKAKIALVLQMFWNTSTESNNKYSLPQKALWFFLCFCEKLYRVFFVIGQTWRRWRGGVRTDCVKVISVGNLTTGGTGKSVVVAFLVKLLGADSCAILLRGYGRKVSCEKNLVVSDGSRILADVNHTGDEAQMLAHQCGCCVIIGADREKSYNLLRNSGAKNSKYIILDDAYQNHQLKKDCEILLLDARAPFGNGHCLPAGRLREKDCRRADIIMVTHADCIAPAMLKALKEQLALLASASCIVGVRHVINSIVDANMNPIDRLQLVPKKFLAFAGIGSFENFAKSLIDFGLDIGHTQEFPDHYEYASSDLKKLLLLIKKHGYHGAITTEKDWVKIIPLIKQNEPTALNIFFMAPVSIEFLSSQEYSQFIGELYKKIMH